MSSPGLCSRRPVDVLPKPAFIPVSRAPTKPERVTFTPEKPGTYEFKCAKFCGMGHSKMKGEIVVSE